MHFRILIIIHAHLCVFSSYPHLAHHYLMWFHYNSLNILSVYLLVPLICKKFVVILIQNFIIVPTCMREETLQLTERIKSFVHCSCLDELNLLNRLIWFSSRPILLNSQRLTHPIALLFYFSFCNYIHPPHKSALL